MYASRVIGELSAPRGDWESRKSSSSDTKRNTTRRSRSRKNSSNCW